MPLVDGPTKEDLTGASKSGAAQAKGTYRWLAMPTLYINGH